MAVQKSSAMLRQVAGEPPPDGDKVSLLTIVESEDIDRPFQ